MPPIAIADNHDVPSTRRVIIFRHKEATELRTHAKQGKEARRDSTPFDLPCAEATANGRGRGKERRDGIDAPCAAYGVVLLVSGAILRNLSPPR